MGLPLVPAAAYEDLFWARNGLGLEAETMKFSL